MHTYSTSKRTAVHLYPPCTTTGGTAMKQTMVEVPLDNGTTWTGTERELRTKHPDWLPYAKIIQLGATATRQTEEAKQGRKAHPGAIDLLTPRTREHVRGYYDTDEENDEQYYPQRQHTSAVRYTTPAPPKKRPKVQVHPGERIEVPPRRTATHTATPTHQRTYAEEPAPKAKRRGFLFFRRPKHPMLYLGIGMIVMLGLWTGLTYAVSWYTTWQDDLHFGRPRTAQYDVVVGHNDSPTDKTHIIALNLNRTVVIIELPGGDTSKARIYKGPTLFGQGSELAPVTLSFRDTTGDGRLDMIVHVQDSQLIYLNQKVNGVWQFVPQQSQ